MKKRLLIVNMYTLECTKVLELVTDYKIKNNNDYSRELIVIKSVKNKLIEEVIELNNYEVVSLIVY